MPGPKKDGLIIWHYDFALSTFYEVETESIEGLVPKRLAAVQVAPGVSLINLTALNFPAGGLDSLPEFQELILSVIVSPDLSRGVPASAMHVISLGSTNAEHLDHCVSYYKLPVYGQFTKADLQHDPHTALYEDSHGPIARLRNVHPSPDYFEGERYFQAFVEEGDELYVADIVMKGQLYEHQDANDSDEFWNHPFFRSINLTDAEPTVFMQIFNQPSTPGEQFYPRPEKFG